LSFHAPPCRSRTVGNGPGTGGLIDTRHQHAARVLRRSSISNDGDIELCSGVVAGLRRVGGRFGQPRARKAGKSRQTPAGGPPSSRESHERPDKRLRIRASMLIAPTGPLRGDTLCVSGNEDRKGNNLDCCQHSFRRPPSW
jgi:hypothetical protein